jgi:dihydroxy-acid dehydratase
MTVSGRTLGEEIDAAPVTRNRKVIRIAQEPIFPVGGLAILKGNLAPRGAVIKHSAASPALLKHRGRAVVFSSLEDLAMRIDRDDLDVKADDVLVLQNAPKVPRVCQKQVICPFRKSWRKQESKTWCGSPMRV